MKAILFLACLTFAVTAEARAQPEAASAVRPPNIVLVYIDDMGWGDLSIYGDLPVKTPHIDQLAQEGTRFTQYYSNAPICSPSRVAITTGTYPSRWRIHSYLESREKNRQRGMADYLDPKAPTLARQLRQAGYATGHFGKWHMGGGRDVDDAPLPRAYGFDESVTSFEGLGDRYLWPGRLSEMSAALGRGEIHWTEKHEVTRIYVDHAIDFIRRHQDEPFYVNVWPDDVHDPFIPRSQLVGKYEDLAASEHEQKFFAVLEEMDRQLGRLFDEIGRLGLDEETLILLASDNGPTDWPHYYKQGVEPPGSAGPFRGRKWSLYEGGIRLPLIVRWPGHVPAGAVDEETVLAAFDLFPSLVRLTGAALPGDVQLDGRDVSAVLSGEVVRRTEPIFWYYPNDIKPGDPESLTPTLAVRDGPWKLLVEEDGSGAELYDLEADPAETNNVAAEHPALTRLLTDKTLAWRRALP